MASPSIPMTSTPRSWKMFKNSSVAFPLLFIRLMARAISVMSEAVTPTALPASPMASISESIRSGLSPKPVASALDIAVRSAYSMGVSAAMTRKSERYRSPTPAPSSRLKAMASSSRWAAVEDPLDRLSSAAD